MRHRQLVGPEGPLQRPAGVQDADPAEARERVAAVRAVVPERVRIGVSGDAVGATGLLAGCDLWFSALAGALPGPLLAGARCPVAWSPALPALKLWNARSESA